MVVAWNDGRDKTECNTKQTRLTHAPIPQHIGRKGHQFLSQALRPRRIVLYVVFVLLGAVLSVVGIYGISALKLYTEANRFISASKPRQHRARLRWRR